MNNYSPEAFEALRREIQTKIDSKLSSVGIFFRIFSRVKTYKSFTQKINHKKASYLEQDKKMQDFLGVRITVYFQEDINIVSNILKKTFSFNSESIDTPTPIEFSPQRHNIVFNFPTGSFLKNPNPDYIDNTFEVQIRTIFSEGWHEIEHDLRYKNKSQWEGHPIQSRGLNSIIATLEMCDWSISSLVDDMAYNSYKQLDIQSLLLNKLKLRLSSLEISDYFKPLCKNQEFLKQILRSDRHKLLNFLSTLTKSIPLNATNILWVLCATQKIHDIDESDIPLPLKEIILQ